MEHNKKEIRRALLICLPYLIIIFFLENIDKLLYSLHSMLGNPLLVLYMFTATVIIIILFIYRLIDFRNDYRESGSMAVIPVLLYFIALCNSFWSPLRVSSDIFQPKIVHRAYRKEQYGHAQMKMRANGGLDIRYPGPFGMAEWEYGHWSGRGDTFYLNYDRGIDTVAAKPDTLILAGGGLLTPLGIPDDTLKIYKDHFFIMAQRKKK